MWAAWSHQLPCPKGRCGGLVQAPIRWPAGLHGWHGLEASPDVPTADTVGQRAHHSQSPINGHPPGCHPPLARRPASRTASWRWPGLRGDGQGIKRAGIKPSDPRRRPMRAPGGGAAWVSHAPGELRSGGIGGRTTPPCHAPSAPAAHSRTAAQSSTATVGRDMAVPAGNTRLFKGPSGRRVGGRARSGRAPQLRGGARGGRGPALRTPACADRPAAAPRVRGRGGAGERLRRGAPASQGARSSFCHAGCGSFCVLQRYSSRVVGV
jgi:hypothetical protein